VCNVGAQICMWSNLILYMKQYTPVTERTAANYLTGTLVAMLVGRFVSTQIMKYVPASRLLGIYGVANVLLMTTAVTRPGWSGAYAIVAAGFFLSIMFPTIFALGLKGLGDNTKLAGSFLVMAIVGGALFPLALGWVSQTTGSFTLGYTIPLLGFAAVGVYGFVAPLILPPAENTDPSAGVIVAEFGQGF
jgi:FHS family L-fucose permease-like MFS transporter